MIFYENIIRNIGRTGRANMERITKKFSDGTFYCEDIEDVGIKGVNAPTFVGKAINKLAEYEDAEEQGLLLRLPCKVGTQVWKIKECSGGGRIPNWHEIYNVNFALELLSDFGKTVFLTKEEAEQALAEMKEV